MTLEERADLIAGQPVLTEGQRKMFYDYVLLHLREAVAGAMAERAKEPIRIPAFGYLEPVYNGAGEHVAYEYRLTAPIPPSPFEDWNTYTLPDATLSREQFVKKWREAADKMEFQPPVGEIFAVDDNQGNIRVFEVDGEEVQPLVPDKAAPADLFRLIREKRKAMEEVQPTAIVEAQEPRPKNSFELIQTDIRCNLQDYIQPPPNPEARP